MSSNPPSPSAFAVRVVLSHRVRNAEGGWHWQPVAAQDQIRVTKNRGKVLRFSVDALLPYRPTDVQVYLADYEDTAPAGAVAVASLPGVRLSKDGLSLQSISEPVKVIPDQLPETASYMSEVIAKLTKISRQLQVFVVINTNTNELVGCSVEFQTHNTGKKTSKGEWELNPAPPPHQLKPLLPHQATPAASFQSHQPPPPQQPQQSYHQHAVGNTSPTGHVSGAQGRSPSSSSPSYSSHSSPDYQSPAGATTSPPPNPQQPAQQQQHRYNYHYSQHPQPAHPTAQPQQQQQSSFIPVAQYLQQQQQKQQQQHTAPGLQRQQMWHQYQYNQQQNELQKQQEISLWTTSGAAALQRQPQQQHFKFHQSAAATPVIQAFQQSSAEPSRVVLHRQPSLPSVHGQPQQQQHHYNHQQQFPPAQSTAYAAQLPSQQDQQPQQRRASQLYHQPVPNPDWAPSNVAGFDAGAAAYPSGGYIASLMGQLPMRVDSQVALGSARSSASYASSSSSSVGSSGYDSSDGLLQGKRMRGDDGSRIRMSNAVNQALGDSDDSSEGENDFYQHPEAVEARPGGVSVRTGVHVKGLVRAQAFLHYSDLRLKTSVEDVVDAIQTLSQLEGKRYTWRKDVAGSPINGASAQVSEIDREIAYLQKYVDLDADGSDQEPDSQPTGIKVLGLIAQEVQRVLPEIVQESADGWLSIDYAEIVPILIEAFKEHMQAYHRMQAGFRDEFEAFKGQLRERREKLGDLAAHESGEESDPDSPRGKAHGAVDDDDDLSDDDTDDDDGVVETDECGFELEEIPETRPLARLNFRSKLDVKELAERMSSLIPPRPYNELLHTLRTDKRKRQAKQRSYGVAFFSVGTFLLVVNALLAASIPIFVFHLGTAHKGTGALLYDYSVDTERSYTVSVLGNVVSVQGTSSSSSSSASVSSLSSLPSSSLPSTLDKRNRNRAAPSGESLTPVKGASSSSSSSSTSHAERDALRPPPTGKPNDQITCRMLSGDGSDNLIFQAEFSWSLADPRGGYLSVNYIVEILHIIEYEETDGLAGYQRGEELFIFGNSTGKEAVWDSWNVLNRTQNDTKIQNWHAYTTDSIFFVHGSVSERKVIDQRFGHNLTSNSIRVDLIITDFPFTRPNTTLALVMRVRSKDPMVLVTAPVPTSESGVHITQIGGDGKEGNDGGNTKGDPDIDVGDDDVMDAFNDTDIDDDDFGDAFNDTESDLGGRAAERFGGGEPRLMPSPPPWVHQRVVIDKVGNGTITGNVQGVFDWPLLVTHGPNITDNLLVTGGEQSLVLAERLLGDELDFNEPGGGGVAPKELSRVFSFSFYEAPQSSVYRWSFNLGVDNIT